MADPTNTVAGMYGALYFTKETEPNSTPDAEDWLARVAPLKDFSPTFNPNIVPITSAGSKRQVGYTQGAAYDLGAGWQTELWGDVWLEYLEMLLGSATGTGSPCTDGDSLPTYSLLGLICRARGTANEYERAALYNGFKITNGTISKSVGPDPVSLSISGRLQYAQMDDGTFPSDLPQFVGFQGTGGSPLTINSLPDLPDPELPPVKYYHWRERIKYSGGAEEDLPRVGGWDLGVSQALTPIPDRVIGADGLVYPLWAGWGEDSMELSLGLRVTPEDLEYYEQVVYAQEPIEYLDLEYTAPPGYSVPSKTIRLKDGFFETGDWSIRELATMEQALPARFGSVEII